MIQTIQTIEIKNIKMSTLHEPRQLELAVADKRNKKKAIYVTHWH